MRDNHILIGVDGGGTGCRVALARPNALDRTEARGGPANVSDFDGACARIIAAIEAALAQAGIGSDDRRPVVAHLGLAGVTGPVMAERVRAAILQAFRFRKVTVTGDGATMIMGALGGADGAVVALGTGSFIGRRHQGQMATIGGRGFLLGDQASGAWLGKRALQELMLAVDGLRPHSTFSRTLLSRYGSDAAGVIAFAIAARPADFADLGPEVLAAADQDDSLARGLVAEGAHYIIAGLAAIGWRAGEPLCLAGGLGPRYASYLPDELCAALTAVQGSALDGALQLAAEGAT